MWNSGFFNALLKDGVYDRKYNADDYSNALSMIVGNGVVNALNGTSLQVNDKGNINGATYALEIKQGWAWINGKWVHNDTDDSTGKIGAYTLATLPMCTKGYKRIDRVFLQLNPEVSGRTITPVLKQSAEARETVTDIPTGTSNEICLAEVLVDYTGDNPFIFVEDKRTWVNGYFGDNWEQYCASITQVVNNFIQNKTTEFNNWFRSVRNDVATVTLLKPLINTVTVQSSGSTFSIGIPEYRPAIDVLEVYTNGVYERLTNDYAINETEKTVTFNSVKSVGAIIDFVVTKAIDGRFYENPDISLVQDVESRITDIFAQLEAINNRYSEVNYECAGEDDNIAISNIVKTFLNANATDNSRLKLNIVGTFGATNPAKEQVTNAEHPEDYARWFDFSSNTTNRRVVLDFSNCAPITLPLVNNTKYVVFFGANQEIERCVLKAGTIANSGTKIVGVFGRGSVIHRSCRYGFISDLPCDFTRHGKFDDCEVTIVSKSGNATAFYTDPSGCICEVNGGIYWLFTGANVSGDYSTKFVYHTQTSESEGTPTYTAVTILNNVSVPNHTLMIDGQSFIQDGTIFKTNANAGGYIRCKNLMTPTARMANDSIDSSTNAIIEGTMPLNRAKGQTPYI